MKDRLLGIDVGTYSSKAVLTDLAGRVLETAVVEHGISLPAPGHVEQDADAVWWHDVCALSREILARPGVDAQRVAGVAVSAIGPCLLALDARMRPLRPGILYGVDTRATAEIAELESEIGVEALAAFSLMHLSSQAMGPKIRWLRHHEPDVWQQTVKLTSATSYLAYRLTGRLCMDHHSASYFMPLYNPASGAWDARHSAGVCPIDMLPELAWADECAGTVDIEAAGLTGLAPGTPVAVGTIDALSEAVSVGAVAPGDLMLMHGSTTFFVLSQDRPTPDARFWSVAGISEGSRVLAAGMSTTGSVTRWFRDELAADLPAETGYAELFRAAEQVPPGADGLLALPYFSGERTPINDPDASGVLMGLTLAHTRAHLFRALLEGVGFGVRHNLDAFAETGARVERVVAVGGGAKSDAWLQIISDITGVNQLVPEVTIGASYGNAFLAGRASGLLSEDDLSRWIAPGRVIVPNSATQERYDDLFALYKTLYRNTREVMHALKALANSSQPSGVRSPRAP